MGAAGTLRRLLTEKEAPDPMWERGRGLYLARVACDDECWARTTSTGSIVGKEVLMRFAMPGQDEACSAA